MVRHGRARHHHRHHRAIGMHHHHHRGGMHHHHRTYHHGWTVGAVRVGNYRSGTRIAGAGGGCICGVIMIIIGVFHFFPGAVLTGIGSSGPFSGGVEMIIGPILLCIGAVLVLIGIILIVIMCKKMKTQQAADAEAPPGGTVVTGPAGTAVVAGAVPTGAQPAPYGTQPAPYGQPVPYAVAQPVPYGQPPPGGAPPQGYNANFSVQYPQPGVGGFDTAPPTAYPQPTAPTQEGQTEYSSAPPPTYDEATAEKY